MDLLCGEKTHASGNDLPLITPETMLNKQHIRQRRAESYCERRPENEDLRTSQAT